MNEKATIWGALHYVVTGKAAESNAIAFYLSKGFTCVGSSIAHIRRLEDGKGHVAYMTVEAL
jgi:hypothetical protein